MFCYTTSLLIINWFTVSAVNSPHFLLLFTHLGQIKNMFSALTHTASQNWPVKLIVFPSLRIYFVKLALSVSITVWGDSSLHCFVVLAIRLYLLVPCNQLYLQRSCQWCMMRNLAPLNAIVFSVHIPFRKFASIECEKLYRNYHRNDQLSAASDTVRLALIILSTSVQTAIILLLY